MPLRWSANRVASGTQIASSVCIAPRFSRRRHATLKDDRCNAQNPESGAKNFSERRPHPPYCIQAQQALFGANLLRNELYNSVASFLEPDHFYDPLHRQIYAVWRDLIRSGQPADPITLSPYFEYADRINGDLTVMQYLKRLTADAIACPRAAEYSRTIYELAFRRALWCYRNEKHVGRHSIGSRSSNRSAAWACRPLRKLAIATAVFRPRTDQRRRLLARILLILTAPFCQPHRCCNGWANAIMMRASSVRQNKSSPV